MDAEETKDNLNEMQNIKGENVYGIEAVDTSGMQLPL